MNDIVESINQLINLIILVKFINSLFLLGKHPHRRHYPREALVSHNLLELPRPTVIPIISLDHFVHEYDWRRCRSPYFQYL